MKYNIDKLDITEDSRALLEAMLHEWERVWRGVQISGYELAKMKTQLDVISDLCLVDEDIYIDDIRPDPTAPQLWEIIFERVTYDEIVVRYEDPDNPRVEPVPQPTLTSTYDSATATATVCSSCGMSWAVNWTVPDPDPAADDEESDTK